MIDIYVLFVLEQSWTLFTWSITDFQKENLISFDRMRSAHNYSEFQNKNILFNSKNVWSVFQQ